MLKVNPYLNFDGNAKEAFEFYKSIFGSEFSAVFRFKDMPLEGITISKEDEEKMMHISLPLNDNQTLMASDILESLGQTFVKGNNVYISVHPDSKEEADRLFNALSEGGKIEMPIEDQQWGDYYGSFIDKFGVGWMINFNAEY